MSSLSIHRETQLNKTTNNMTELQSFVIPFK